MLTVYGNGSKSSPHSYVVLIGENGASKLELGEVEAAATSALSSLGGVINADFLLSLGF
jgi:hypothetical protein